MKMKTSLIVGAFSLALFIAGCTTAPAAVPEAGPAGPQGATGAAGDPGQDADRHRTEEEKRADDQRRADEVKRSDDQKRTDDLKRGDDQRRADEKFKERQDAGCAAGEHVFTNSDGRKTCVKD
jgi:hypothetical protein